MDAPEIASDAEALRTVEATVELGALGVLLERLASVVDELQGFDPTALPDAGLEDGLRRFVTQCRRLPAVRHALVAETTARALPALRHHRSAGSYLRELVRTSNGEGNAWAREADTLTPRRVISTGELLAPVLPETAAAVGEGAISDRHVALITDTMRKFPAAVPAVERAGWEALLARQARILDPDNLDRACRHVLAAVDPDGALGSSDEERARKRELVLGRAGRDGMTPVRGLLDPETAALARAALDPLAAPQPTPDDPDRRSTGQRYHDALRELCRRALAQGDLPVRHGQHATVLVTIGLDDLENRTGLAATAHGGHLTVRDLLRHAADAGLIPVVLDADGQVLHYGHEQRLATEAQRRTLMVTDIGCTWPGCSVPGVWCECAHCEPFRTSGRTSIDDLALLCGYHHRYADTHDWTMKRTGGRVWFTPPAWIDSDQVPRTNEYFRPLRT